MPKLLHIGSSKLGTPGACLGENGPKTAETRPDWVYRDWIGIRTRPSYSYLSREVTTTVHTKCSRADKKNFREDHLPWY